jgi:hypothetical protein
VRRARTTDSEPDAFLQDIKTSCALTVQDLAAAFADAEPALTPRRWRTLETLLLDAMDLVRAGEAPDEPEDEPYPPEWRQEPEPEGEY